MKYSIVILIIITLSFYAVESYSFPYKFEHIGIDQGHSNDWVKAIYQDSLGFIWFGTNAGLFRYDGHSFKEFTNENPNYSNLKDNNIYCLVQDNAHNLWIGTSKGICRYNMELNTFYYDTAWPESQINKIVYHNNTIYAATMKGVFYIDLFSNHSRSLETDGIESINNQRINDLAIDHKEDLLIGTSLGLYRIDLNKKVLSKIENSESEPSFSASEITSLYIDKQERIWAGTFSNGLYLIENYPDTSDGVIIKHFQRSEEENTSISAGTIRSIVEDFENNIWIAIENRGLNLFKPNKTDASDYQFQKVEFDPRQDESLSGNSIHSMLCDRDGNVWIGTYYEGINRLKNTKDSFRKFTYNPYEKNGLINKNVNVISEIGEEIWIGTENGISIYNPATDNFNNLLLSTNDFLSNVSNSIWSIIQENDENILIGTWGGGVYNYNLKYNAISRFKDFEMPNKNISSMLKDSKGEIWICTMGGGLVQFNCDKNTSKIYSSENTDQNALASNWALYIYENSKNEVWVSTMEGVEILKNEEKGFSHFDPELLNESIAGQFNLIDMIFEDSQQNMWFTSKNGLFYLNQTDSIFGLYSTKEVLPTNLTKAILEDDHGNLWVSTNKGILKIENGVKLPQKPVVRMYDINDNLQGLNYTIKCALKDKQGRMYFGGNNGFNVFHPDSIFENTKLPAIVFTRLSVLNREVEKISKSSPVRKDISYADQLVLKHDQKSFSIEFAALNYTKSNKNKYSYMLEGLDGHWINLGNTNVINFSNLNSGKYTLLVKGSNNDGIWNETPRQLNITILPPPWKTWWAFASYLLFTIALLYYFRNNALQKERLKKYYLEKYQLSGLSSIQPGQPEVSNAEEQFISKMITVVEENMDNPDFKNETFAEELGMSVAVLYRKTKALLNCSPSVFIRDLRIKRALQLLSSGNLTVSEVAIMVGFSDPHYFGKWFKKSYGKTPSDCLPK